MQDILLGEIYSLTGAAIVSVIVVNIERALIHARLTVTFEDANRHYILPEFNPVLKSPDHCYIYTTAQTCSMVYRYYPSLILTRMIFCFVMPACSLRREVYVERALGKGNQASLASE